MPVQIANGVVEVSADGAPPVSIPTASFPEFLAAHISGDPLTRFIETEVADPFVANGMPVDQTYFVVRLIFAWGGSRGNNLKRLYDQAMMTDFQNLRDCLFNSYVDSIAGNYSDAIERHEDIAGAGLSFFSKILKFLCPNHGVVLDSVIRSKLGYAESNHGYHTFVEDCATIRDHLNDLGIPRDGGDVWRTADVEMAIFKHVNP